jgi:hypothetical protein
LILLEEIFPPFGLEIANNIEYILWQDFKG